MIKLFKTTKQWSNYWENRRADWNKCYLQTFNHPHRQLLVKVLKSFPWLSLIEIGCNAGANLVAIVKAMPEKQLGGIDLNPEAIELCQKTLAGGIFKVNRADDIMISDDSCDVILSDMCLIYVDLFKIKDYLDEIKRVSRSYVVLCELNSKSWFDRFVIKWKEGYNLYDYKKLLEKHGFYDVVVYKLPKEFWPESDLQQKYCSIIVARVPKK